MIIITGPGRSGTSLVAQAYRQAGVDVGGEWDPEVNAGLEDVEIVRMNQHICKTLGTGLLGRRGEPVNLDEVLTPRASALVKSVVPAPTRRAIKRALANSAINRRRGVPLIDWEAVDGAATTLRQRLHEEAGHRQVVKDPLFCWTLPVWLAAEAPIEAVVLTFRNVDAMVSSRATARQSNFSSRTDARNYMIYAIGNAISSCADHDMPLRMLRFPDFLHDGEQLRSMPLPNGLERDSLIQAFHAVADTRMVHQG